MQLLTDARYLTYYLYVNPQQSEYRQNINLHRYQNHCRIYLDEYEEPEKIQRGCLRTEFNIG